MVALGLDERSRYPQRIGGLTLHKLAFLAHGIFYSQVGTPLLEGDVVAGVNGPSIQSYRDAVSASDDPFATASGTFLGYKSFQLPEGADTVLDFVIESYSHLGDGFLQEFTSKFLCYQNNYVPGASAVIPPEDIKKSFSKWIYIQEEISRLEKEQY